ncbi:MAG TPA: ANTAR domain-containing protein [Candidatus Ruthenibacterium merdigallinarum]|nr:ANTAR domain-containing protein [Candidatus Ruthenibacterium merdigallinarum]
MADILIAAEARFHDALKTLFAGPAGEVRCCTSAGEARRALAEGAFSLAVVNTPLPDEFGRELALAAADANAQVIVLCAAAQADRLAAALEKHGVFVAARPLNRQSAAFLLRFARAAAARMQKLQSENRRLVRRLDEMRAVTRAKCALVRYCDMTEAQAHRALEQRAMDARVSLKDAALDVLARFEEPPA